MVSKFQHTAARRRLGFGRRDWSEGELFQHTAARRRLGDSPLLDINLLLFQHTAARRRLGVAARSLRIGTVRFNTQPPEGGWMLFRPRTVILWTFQHTAARRRLVVGLGSILIGFMFQHTAARRRLVTSPTFAVSAKDCFNTQPPEGGWSKTYINAFPSRLFQHTAARRRLVPLSKALLHQVSQPRFR